MLDQVIKSKNKLHVVWLCHFSSKELREALKQKPSRSFSPWINELIKIFQNQTEVDIEILMPNIFQINISTVLIGNIKINFYNYTIPFIPKKFQRYFNELTNWFLVTKSIIRKIDRIAPDLVHIHGAEIPYYSAAAIRISKNYPTLLTIQGFINGTKRDESFLSYWSKCRIEKKTISYLNNFGVRDIEMQRRIKSWNSSANFHWHEYPANIPDPRYYFQPKEYDIVYFSRICFENGIEEYLEVLAYVKNIMPDLRTLLVAQYFDANYFNKIRIRINQLNLQDSIEILKPFADQEELFETVSKAKITVLPTHSDAIPGVIIESMYMGNVVVANSVGGIPRLNLERHSVLLSECYEIQTMANNIIFLLKNPDEREKIKYNAKATVEQLFGHIEIMNSLIKIYAKICSKAG